MLVSNEHGILGVINNVDEAELMLRLSTHFTAPEALGIIRTVKKSNDSCYNHDHFMIMYSYMTERYTVFIADAEYLDITKMLDMEPVAPPTSTRDKVKEIKLYNNTKFSDDDVDYIMNCKAIVDRHTDPENKTGAWVVWGLCKTLLESKKKLNKILGRNKAKEEEEENDKE